MELSMHGTVHLRDVVRAKLSGLYIGKYYIVSRLR
jgi:hypothetical protein